MKQGPYSTNYRPVVFQDLNNGTTFVTRSTVDSEETITLDGVEYPLVKVHISSSSHPFFTGEERIVDIEGRVDKFKARRETAAKAKEEKVAKIAKPKAKKESKAEAQKLGAAPADQKTQDSRQKTETTESPKIAQEAPKTEEKPATADQ